MTQDGAKDGGHGDIPRSVHPGEGRGEGAAVNRRGALSRAGLAALLGLAGLLAPAAARAEQFDVNDADWAGGSGLLEIARTELGAGRVRAVAVLDWNEVQPEDGVLAVHPLRPLEESDAAAFMKAGGRLAVLLDEDGAGEETVARFHIYRVPPPARPVAALRNRAVFAIAEPVVDVVAGHTTGAHPVVAHVQQLVTNHPTALRHPALTPVLRIRAIGEPDAILAVAGQVGRGRLFAMGDASAVTNQMLRYPGNRAFVSGLVRYLVDDDGSTRRQGRLFVVTNKFGEEGSFGGQGGLLKDLDPRKALRTALEEARRDGFPAWTHLVLSALAALGLAAWVARSAARPYQSPLPRYARPRPLVAQGGVAGRFAVLAAPSSPRNLALLELKSALFEALQPRLGFAGEPGADALAKMVQRAGSLDGSAHSELKEILGMMHQVETAVVAGRPAPVSQRDLARAAEVVRSVLASVTGVPAVHGGQFAASAAPAVSAAGAASAAFPPGSPRAPVNEQPPRSGESAG